MNTWRDVFDGYKVMGHQNIYSVNEFLYTYTTYSWFAFNGIVYKVCHPKTFTMKNCNTGLTVDDLK